MLQQLRIEGYFPLNSKRLQNTSNLHNAKRLRFECLEDRLPLTSIGLNFTAFTGTSSPIDVMGSVGLDHIAVQTNREFSVWDKDTGANLLTMTHDEFWSSALGIQPTLIRAFDPRIIYDHLTDRWFSVAGDRRDPVRDDLLLGVSSTSDPSGAWTAFEFDTDPTNTRKIDFPKMGINEDGVYVYGSLFCNTGQTCPNGSWAAIISVPKSDLVSQTPTAQNATVFLVEYNTAPTAVSSAAPVTDFSSPTEPATLIDVGLDTRIPRTDISNVTGPSPATLLPTVNILTGMPGTPENPLAPQPGTTTVLDTGQKRTRVSPMRVGDSIWAVRGEKVDGRSGIRWYELDAANNTVIQTGTIGDPDLYLSYPSIAANAQGDIVIGFDGSSENQFASAYVTVGQTVNGETSFEPITLLKAGSAFFELAGEFSRHGDYTATVADPTNPSIFWTFTEFIADDIEGFARKNIQVSEIVTVPQVTEVVIGSSIGVHDDYVVPTGSEQIQTVPVGAANQIKISFSEAVTVQQGDLEVVSAIDGTPYTVPTPTYDATTNTATWTFATEFSKAFIGSTGDQIEITLFDTVQDAAGNALDGEWTNPISIYDTNPNISQFPSGDKIAGGDFTFYISNVPGDFNRNNFVDVSDFNIWNDNRFTGGGKVFEEGDGSGDGFVTNIDFNIWVLLIFTDWSTWPTTEGAMAQGGNSRQGVDDNRLAKLRAAFSELLEEHQIYKNGEVNSSLTAANWDNLADDIFARFAFFRP